jgi:thymidylate synthase (FAD)
LLSWLGLTDKSVVSDSKPSNEMLYTHNDRPVLFVHDKGYVYTDTGEKAPDNVTLMDWRPRVFSEAKVYLVQSTVLDNSVTHRFLEQRGMDFDDALYPDPDHKENWVEDEDEDLVPEIAGRLCYMSFNKELRRPVPDHRFRNEHYLENTVRTMKHGSITEHTVFSFIIDDFGKNTTQELVRHRVGVAYSIQSSRYVDFLSKEYFGKSGHCVGVYVPPEIRQDWELWDDWLRAWQACAKAYAKSFFKLRQKGIPKKRARSMSRQILPGGVGNALMFTVNARELNHIFELRANTHAEDEFRVLALKLWGEVKHLNLFSHWELAVEQDGREYLRIKDVAQALPAASSTAAFQIQK